MRWVLASLTSQVSVDVAGIRVARDRCHRAGHAGHRRLAGRVARGTCRCAVGARHDRGQVGSCAREREAARATRHVNNGARVGVANNPNNPERVIKHNDLID
jgi:hypothetical protein